MYSNYNFVGPAMGVLAVLYLLPSFIAIVRRRPRIGRIIGVNLLLGWTVAGWVWSMIWALADSQWMTWDSPRGRKPCPGCGRSLRAAARRCHSCGYTISAKR